MAAPRDRKPQRYAMDGFIPRTPRKSSTPSRRRATMDTGSTRGQHAVHQDAHKRFAFDNDSEITGSLKEPIDFGLGPEQPKKPPFWRIKKRRAYKKAQRASWSRRKRITRRVIKIMAAILVVSGIVLGIIFLINTGRIFDGNILGLLRSTKLRGEDEGRVNILLAGTSEDSIGHQGADLTDSIMLLSIDTENNKAFTVSIPRDLWVDYGRGCSAGYEGKINVVYQCGKDTNFKESGYADGGMGMLQKVVSETLDIKIHYYGKIGYTAFKDAVDAVGGIQVAIDSDDPRGIYDPNFQPHEGGPLTLSNGKHIINGVTALRLARSRNSAGGYGMNRGDFDRTSYQQKMIVALKNKALSVGVLANPGRITELMNSAGNNVKTDFRTDEIRRLYELAQLIDSKNITTIDLASEDVNLLTTGSYGGQSIVMPVAGMKDFTQVQAYFKRLTSKDPAAREGASVVVLNGSGVLGAAQKRADVLLKRGVDVPVIANAVSDHNDSLIIDQSGGKMPATRRLLEKQFKTVATTSRTMYPDAVQYEVDFVVVLGKVLPSQLHSSDSITT